MADSFDTLSIQITASAGRAISTVNKLADSLVQLNAALQGIDASNLEQVSNATRQFGSAASTFKVTRKRLESITNAFQQVGQASGTLATPADAMKNLAELSRAASEGTDKAAKSVGGSATSGFERFKGALKGVGAALSKVIQHSGHVSKGVKKISSASKSASVTAKGLAKELLRVGKMMKLMITRMILRKIISGVADGFKNLAKYSSQVNASMSLLWNSFRQLGNSIAAAVSPLLNAFAPALNYIIQLIIKAVNAINQLFSALVGLGTWTRAKTLTDDYAKSLDKAGGSAKELKKTVLGFDELNQLQDNKNSGGGTTDPSNMFETAQIDEKWKKLADKIKDYWQKLVNPIKRAWAKAGDYVKKAWTKAFENVKKLALDIADDFLEVWNQPRTVQMLEDMFRIVGNIGTFIANIANSFDKAWNKADVGKRIFEDIRNLCADIVAVIENITLSWALWADKVNFTPLLEGLEGWLASLEDPINAIMGIIQDLNEDFIQPFAKWLIEKGIPDLIQVFTDLNDKIDWETLRERLDRVWKALEPFAETVWTGFVQFVSDISDAIAKFVNSDTWDAFIDTLIKWTQNIDADDVASGLRKIAAALLLYKGITGLYGVAGGLSALGVSAAGLTPLASAAALILGLGASIKMLKDDIQAYKEYLGKDTIWECLFSTDLETDKAKQSYAEAKKSNPYLNGTVPSYIKETAQDSEFENAKMTVALKKTTLTVSNAFAEQGVEVEKATQKSSTALERLKEVAQRTADDTTTKTADARRKINSEMTLTQEDIDKTSQKIKDAFSKDSWTFDGVADGLRETFEDAKNAIKGVWNGIADSLNGSHSVFGRSFDINLPKLYASGGFPSQGSMFIAGESGAELVGNINGRTAVANNDQITTGIASAVYAAMVSANGGNGGTRYINNTIQIDGKTIARAVTVGQDKLNRLYSPTQA